MTKRSLIYLAGGILALSAGYAIQSHAPSKNGTGQHVHSKQTPATLKKPFDDIIDEKADAPAFLERFIERMPEYQQAKTDGVIKGFVYQPNVGQIREYISRTLEGSADKERRLADVGRDFEKTYSKSPIMTVPTASFGDGTPQYLVINKSLFTDAGLQGDEDLESTISMILQEARENRKALKIGNNIISRQDVIDGSCHENFMEQLIRTRAIYSSLETIVKLRITGQKSVSEKYCGTLTAGFVNQHNLVTAMATTPLEREVISAQEKEWTMDVKADGERLYTARINIEGHMHKIDIEIEFEEKIKEIAPEF